MEKQRRPKIWPWIVVAFAALLVVARFVVVKPYNVPAGSMIPTLKVNDHFFVNLLKKHPARGDVIVFRYPKDPDKEFVKRVIGIGGDTVEIKQRVVYINGSPIQQVLRDQPKSYNDYDESTKTWSEHACTAYEESLGGKKWTIIHTLDQQGYWGPRQVPLDSYFVLGDNRDNSHDSRYWGFVPQDLVQGTLIGVWYSPGK